MWLQLAQHSDFGKDMGAEHKHMTDVCAVTTPTVCLHQVQHKHRGHAPHECVLLWVHLGDCVMQLEEGDVGLQTALDKAAELVALFAELRSLEKGDG